MSDARTPEDVISEAHYRIVGGSSDVNRIPGHDILVALREAGYELTYTDSDNWRHAITTREAIRDEFYKAVADEFREAERKLAKVTALRDRLAGAATWDERPDIVSHAYAEMITEALATEEAGADV